MTPFIHAKCPRKTAQLYAKHNYSILATAKALKVNIAYVYYAIIEGRAPSVKAEAVRKALGFPKTDRKPAGTKQKTASPDWLNWWRHLSKDERRAQIQNLYKQEFHK